METEKRRSQLRQWLGQISVPIYLLVMLFGISSWVDINSIFVELPLLVKRLPEGWSLPSYLIFLIQLANVSPLCYVIAVKLCPQKIKEWPIVVLIISVGAIACLSLVFFWDKTSLLWGDRESSTGLLSLCLVLAISDCSSSVIYLTYMAQFRAQYITAIYIGMGLSGLIPGLVGLIQGAGGDPKCVNQTTVLTNETTGINYTDWRIIDEFEEPLFSIEGFFLFLFGMMMTSGAAFLILHLAPFSKKARINKTKSYKSKVTQTYTLNHDYDKKPDKDPLKKENNHFTQNDLTSKKEEIENNKSDYTASDMSTEVHATGQNHTEMTRGEFILLLVITGWVNSLQNGIVPSIQSYAALPYGSMAYNLLVRLSAIANPLAAFLALFHSTKSIRCELVLVTTVSLLVGYQFVLALYSPEPPLQHTVIGSILVVSSAVLSMMLLSYSKVTIAAMLNSYKGRLGLMWCGAVTQIGSFLGAMFIFVLVNIVKLFTSVPRCG